VQQYRPLEVPTVYQQETYGEIQTLRKQEHSINYCQGGRNIMRILFEVLLLSIVIGAVVVFYKIAINYLFPKKKEKNDGE